VIGRISKVRKRDGRLVEFDESKIADAVYKAACATGAGDRFLAEELAGVVTLFLEKRYAGAVPGIEEIQDMVEKVLIETGHVRMAKAYILYRERRARAREQVSVTGESSGGPRVGNPAKAMVTTWSKGRITEALVREADLDEKVAGKIAAAVEEKVFDCRVRRITTSAIRSLVETELFLHGYGDRVGRQALVGLPRYDVDRLLRGAGSGGGGWRARGPGDLRRRVADAVLAQYALAEVYSSEVVDAHLDARIHIADVGAPFEWLAASVPAAPASDAEGWVEAAALRARRLADVVTREVALLCGPGGNWCREPGAALVAARRLLAHPALPIGTGRSLALVLPACDSSGLSEAVVKEHWARFRSGSVEGLPSVVLRIAASQVATPEGRRVLLPALAAAAETGRIHLAFQREEGGIVTPSYRVPLTDAPTDAALGVGGVVSVNVAALAQQRPAGEEQLVEMLDSILSVALKALRQKRSYMEALQSDPGGPLYGVAAGASPLVAGGRGVDLVRLLGVSEAAKAVESDAGGVARLSGRIRSYTAVRLAEEGRQMRLRVFLAGRHGGHAERRFFGGEPSGDFETYALPADKRLESLEPLFDAVGGRLTLRFPRESAPAPESLYDTLGLLADDARIAAVRLAPWPDRSVRAATPRPADL
jgi:hypothetical protein